MVNQRFENLFPSLGRGPPLKNLSGHSGLILANLDPSLKGVYPKAPYGDLVISDSMQIKVKHNEP